MKVALVVCVLALFLWQPSTAIGLRALNKKSEERAPGELSEAAELLLAYIKNNPDKSKEAIAKVLGVTPSELSLPPSIDPSNTVEESEAKPGAGKKAKATAYKTAPNTSPTTSPIDHDSSKQFPNPKFKFFKKLKNKVKKILSTIKHT